MARTKTYAEFETAFKARAGLNQIFTEEQTIIKELFKMRLRQTYYAYPWSALCTYGEARATSSSIVPFTEGVLNEIGEFFAIFRYDPTVTTTTYEPMKFKLVSTGALILETSVPATAYVYYRTACSDFGSGWESAVTIPEVFFDYLVCAVHADWLRSEGSGDEIDMATSDRIQRLADMMLEDAMFQDGFRQQQQEFTRVITHQSTQTRD